MSLFLLFFFSFFQEKDKGSTLSDSLSAIDQEMKRTDQLLYQMIPKSVALRLRKGEPAMSTCKVSELVPE